jgi:BirA family biotin operon repressor/biotin-[acetyl-CoA-carboxylase] ligase
MSRAPSAAGDPPPPWLREAARRLQGHRVGGIVEYRASVPSTNDRARSWIEQGGPDGLVVVAGEQTAGRGRRGREWESPPGLGLYLSVGLRPGLPGGRAPWLTFLGAVAAAEGLRRLAVPCDIRWPNDLDVAGRKLGGILVENRLEEGRITSAVMGIGVNLLQRAGDFPPALAGLATSVRLAAGSSPDPGAVMEAILERLDLWYGRLTGADPTAAGERLLERWRFLAPCHRGLAVEVEMEEGSFQGVTEGLETDGGLRVRQPGGELRVVRFGELRRLQRART